MFNFMFHFNFVNINMLKKQNQLNMKLETI